MAPPDITQIQLDMTSWQGVITLGLLLLAFVILPAYFNYRAGREMKAAKEVQAADYSESLARIEAKLDGIDARVAFLESTDPEAVARR